MSVQLKVGRWTLVELALTSWSFFLRPGVRAIYVDENVIAWD
jgi:hypothetical protein